MEGIYLFYKVVMVFSTRWGEYGAKYAPLLGWGVPVLIVIVSVLTSRNMNNRHGAMVCYVISKLLHSTDYSMLLSHSLHC